MEAGGRRRPARQARPARLRALEGLEEGVRAGDRGLAVAVGPRPPGLAHRVLGDGAEVPRRRLRHPRRRRRPALPAPRERAGPVPRGRAPVRVVLDAQRLDHHRRREDEQVARQLAADPGRARAGPRDRAAVLHRRGALPLARRVQLRGARRGGGRRSGGSRASSSGPPTCGDGRVGDDLPAGVRRRDGRRPRHAGRGRGRSTTRCARATSCSTPATPTRRASARADGAGDARRARALDPSDPAWADQRRRRPAAARTPSTCSSPACSSSAPRPARPRTSPPPTRSATGSRPPASRSRTPRPARSGRIGEKERARRGQATRSARARSARPAREPDRRAPGGRVKRGLEGKGPTPKAKDRPNHKVYKQRQKEERVRRGPARSAAPASTDAEWVAGRNSVVEALRAGVPVNGVYVAEGAERDGRLREAFKLAAERGISLLEVTKRELDRMTDGAVHQGLAARIPAYEYAHPDDLLDRAAESRRAAADRRARLGHRPAQPRRRRPQRGRLRRARRRDPRAPRGRHDRVGLEDQRRRRRPDPGRADRQPGPPAEGLPGRRLHGRRPRRRRRRRRCPTSTSPTARSCSWSAPRARACPGWSPRPATSWSRSRWPTSWSRSTPASPPASRSTRSPSPRLTAASPHPVAAGGSPVAACSGGWRWSPSGPWCPSPSASRCS